MELKTLKWKKKWNLHLYFNRAIGKIEDAYKVISGTLGSRLDI